MATKIILLTDVENLGLRGDVVDVASGYARNYLLPRRMAENATPAKVAELERREAHRSRHDARSGDQARELAGKREAVELRFDVNAGPTGTLFGSITATDIAERIRELSGIRVDRRKIHLAEPIKRVGRYQVEIAIFEDVNAAVRTLVVPEGGELPPEEPEAAPEAEATEADAAESLADAEPEPVAEAAAPEAEPEGPAEETVPSGMPEAEPADDIVAEAAAGTLGQTGEPESA
jgi:large subunit ribosomal protein L9